MYIYRHAEEAVKKISKMFGAVLVTGPRQVGKTTMLQHIIAENDRRVNYVSLDDPIELVNAVSMTNTFMKDNPPPVFIDEVQKAPELFPVVKLLIDEEKNKGMFYLSGSQQFQMMKNITESLAGRIGIVNLLGLSMRELSGSRFTKPFLPDYSYLSKRNTDLNPLPYDTVWKIIQRGCLPELCLNSDFDWKIFYGSYLRSYIERDVSELANIGNSVKFTNFMSALAGRTGQLLNLSSVASDVGISQPTANRWLSVLTASNVVYLLKPYSSNLTNRAVKTPKLYFLDTGLCAYLTNWNNPDVLKSGASAGSFFETFVISEILKSYYNQGILDPPLYFYRDKEKKEIDLIIEENNTLYPIEIKKHADPSLHDISSFSVLDKFTQNGILKRGAGGVICLYDRLVSLNNIDRVMPVSYI